MKQRAGTNGISHCGRQEQQPHPIAIGERKNWCSICLPYPATLCFLIVFLFPLLSYLQSQLEKRKNPTPIPPLPKSQKVSLSKFICLQFFVLGSLQDKGKIKSWPISFLVDITITCRIVLYIYITTKGMYDKWFH